MNNSSWNNSRWIDFTAFGELVVELSKLGEIEITHGMKSTISTNVDTASYREPFVNSVFIKVYRKNDSQKIIDFEIDKKPSGEDFIHFSRLSDPLSYFSGFNETYESVKELMESSKKAFKLISDFLYEYLKGEASDE